jgi:hypothetical protein
VRLPELPEAAEPMTPALQLAGFPLAAELELASVLVQEA